MSTEINQDAGAQANQGAEGVAEIETLRAQLAEREAELSKRDETIGSLKREVKDLKKPKDAPSQEQQQQTQSNEPDYARLAFLQSNQVTNPDDQKWLMDESARLKLPLTEVLGMAHVKAQLQTFNDTRVTQAATPDGKNRNGGPNKGEVDYYLAHPDEVPADLELHNKVIDAKMKREENAQKWSSTPFIG